MKKISVFFIMFTLGFLSHKVVLEVENIREVVAYQSCLGTADRSKGAPSPWLQCRGLLSYTPVTRVLLYQPGIWKILDPFYSQERSE